MQSSSCPPRPKVTGHPSVEHYIYDPYSRTEIAAVTFYHDYDLDGDIEAADVALYDWCTSTGFPERARDPMCAFVHNRDGDYELTAADGTLFAAYVASPSYNSNGAPPPEEWERLRTAYLDANNDQVINLYDWYGFQVCEGVTTSTGGMNDHLCLYLFDLDGDGDVDLNEGQQGCNLFTGQWSTAGDGRPGQATGSRFGNPFMWTGQRYDAPTGLYHFLFRSYSPTLGRWLQRDPLGNVDGGNLYEYSISSPLTWIDTFGLVVRVGGGEVLRGRILVILQQLSPGANIDKDGYVSLDSAKKGIGDAYLLQLIDADEWYIFNFDDKTYFEADRKHKHKKTQRHQIRFNKTEAKEPYTDWELLWHELIHAFNWSTGIWKGLNCDEECQTIDTMNKLREEYNKSKDLKPEDKDYRKPRDRRDHDFCR